MEMLITHWDLILIIIVAICGLVLSTIKLLSLPTTKKKQQLGIVLLNLVILAEAKFGQKTGRVKFSFVYSEILKQFTWVKFIPLSVVEDLIEDALAEMRKLLESNVKVKQIVEGDK